MMRLEFPKALSLSRGRQTGFTKRTRTLQASLHITLSGPQTQLCVHRDKVYSDFPPPNGICALHMALTTQPYKQVTTADIRSMVVFHDLQHREKRRRDG